MMLLREAADNYLFNNLIGGTNAMPIATRSHNGWVPLASRWSHPDGRLRTRGAFESLEPGEWQIPRNELAERLPALFVNLDEPDYRLAAGEGNPAVHAGRDLQSLLEEKGIPAMFPDFDFTVDLAGNPWHETPSLGAYEVQDAQ